MSNALPPTTACTWLPMTPVDLAQLARGASNRPRLSLTRIDQRIDARERHVLRVDQERQYRSRKTCCRYEYFPKYHGRAVEKVERPLAPSRSRRTPLLRVREESCFAAFAISLRAAKRVSWDLCGCTGIPGKCLLCSATLVARAERRVGLRARKRQMLLSERMRKVCMFHCLPHVEGFDDARLLLTQAPTCSPSALSATPARPTWLRRQVCTTNHYVLGESVDLR